MRKDKFRKVKILIPPKLEGILDSSGKKKTWKKGLIKVYAAFLYKHNKSNKDGKNDYFDVPSSYLRNYIYDYKKYVNILMENYIIKYYSRNYVVKQDKLDLFSDEEIYLKKYYDTQLGNCMRYRFLIDVEKGKEIDLEIESGLYDDKDFHKISAKSLKYLRLDSRVSLDSFSRRLHSPITARMGLKDGETDINSYKKFFKTLDEKFVAIDAIQCQPRLLCNYMLDKGIKMDENFKKHAISDDFYEYLVSQIDFKGETRKEKRKEAKKAFVAWLNGKYYHSSEEIKRLFPRVQGFFKRYKKDGNYKSMGKKIQKLESDIFIRTILDNIEMDLNLEFCLTVHDSFIVKAKDAERVFLYVNAKHGLDFKIERLN